MVFDRSYEDADGSSEARPELHLHHGQTDGDAQAPHKEPPETRSRAECYDALHAAGSGSDKSGGKEHRAGDAPERTSGWDAIDAEKRPPQDSFHTTPARDKHILDGDGPDKGGGHRHGTGKPDKTEFPQIWEDKHVLRNVVDVARNPDAPPEYQNFNSRWLLHGFREDVKVWAIVLKDGEIWTAWPEEGGPGVVRNPKKVKETP